MSQNHRKMISRNFWLLILNIGGFVFSHESRQHGDYSFKDLREAVNGDYLTPEEQQTLFNSLHLLNCTESKNGPDYRKVSVTQSRLLARNKNKLEIRTIRIKYTVKNCQATTKLKVINCGTGSEYQT